MRTKCRECGAVQISGIWVRGEYVLTPDADDILLVKCPACMGGKLDLQA